MYMDNPARPVSSIYTCTSKGKITQIKYLRALLLFHNHKCFVVQIIQRLPDQVRESVNSAEIKHMAGGYKKSNRKKNVY